jgi:transposase InsO family protein
VLAQADQTKPYTLKTDASSYAIGAVLVQGEEDNEHPVEYASRLLTKPERNYSTTEREALAVVWAVDKFRGYIEGAKTTVLTDHQALKWLMTLKSPTGRLARWALKLQSFDISIRYIVGRTNVVADCLSRPSCDSGNEENCGVCSIIVDMPRKRPKDIRIEQSKDEDIVKIVASLEGTDEEKARYWSQKGYIMNQGLLYRYASDSNPEDAQLVVPKHEQVQVIQTYHDEAIAGHNGSAKTIDRISRRYFWKGMRGQVEAYVRKCLDCQRYKVANQKPTGRLQTTATGNQRFEVVAFDLFGPLPRSPQNHNWIFIVEDIATRWVELFALEQATAEECAKVLLNEIILRYGTPRRFISDNGPQFVSSIVQQLTFCLNIRHGLTPVYHPETNPVERRNRDLKTQLAILVEDDHTSWFEKLPSIRFALNTARSCATGFTPAYLTFGRELRTPDDVVHDLREIVQNENFIPEITPRLLMMIDTMEKAKEMQEMQEERRKEYVDRRRRACPDYQNGDLVLVNTHTLSKASQGFSSKLAPRRDGPYVVIRRHGPASFEVAHCSTKEPVGIYHASALQPFEGTDNVEIPRPAIPIRKRGRPRKIANPTTARASRPRGRSAKKTQ